MKTEQSNKLFTVDDANAALPLVRAITADLSRLSKEVVERRQRLDHLKAGREDEPGDLYFEELAQIEDELSKDSKRLREFAEELRQLGVEPQVGPDSLIDRVDFPSLMHGRLVHLCWRLGEPKVAYWHEPDADYSTRLPLAISTSRSNTGSLGDKPGEEN